MNDRRQLIAEALGVRLRELCDERIASLKPADFGEHASFVSRVQHQFANAETETLRQPPLQSSNIWQESEPVGAAALQALALDQLMITRDVATPPVDQFLQELKEARKSEKLSLQLLTSRYACPINFTCASENAVREFVLEGLMVRDRRKIEEDSFTSNHDFLWHRLNLIAVHARVTDDLRFLDSLNYFFELATDDGRNWLYVSYLALYARALAAKRFSVTGSVH